VNIPQPVKVGLGGAFRATIHGASAAAGSLYFGLTHRQMLGMVGFGALTGLAHFLSDHYFTDQDNH
jgi:hypothetical protein